MLFNNYLQSRLNADDGNNQGAAANNGSDGGTNNGNNGQGQGQEKGTIQLTQAELEAKLQSEADKRVTEALKTAQTKWEADYKAKLETEKKEAERLAKLTEEEKRKELIRQKDEEIAKRENEIRIRELKLDTINALTEKKLPVEFADFLIGADADTTHKNIKTFEATFQKAIQESVESRLKGNPPGGGTKKTDLSFEQQLAEARKARNLIEEIRIKEEAAKEGKVLF